MATALKNWKDACGILVGSSGPNTLGLQHTFFFLAPLSNFNQHWASQDTKDTVEYLRIYALTV